MRDVVARLGCCPGPRPLLVLAILTYPSCLACGAGPRARSIEDLALARKVSFWMRVLFLVVIERSSAPWTGKRFHVSELRSVICLRLVHRPASKCR
eukprot:4409630-Heterocapsa_arctica.AAC.1